jgi:hypothetical protein
VTGATRPGAGERPAAPRYPGRGRGCRLAGEPPLNLDDHHTTRRYIGAMDENRARQVADELRDRGIDAHLENAGIDVYGVRVVLSDGREAIWGNEGTDSLEAEVLLDGDLVGFVPEIPGSEDFDEPQIVDAIARADYDQPVGRELPTAPPPGKPLRRDGGLFRRFRDGFRYDSES